MMASVYRLDVRAASVTAGDVKIVRDVSLSLQSGELVAVLGPSGSGKSTLLRAMTGFRPGQGRVHLCGRDLYADFEELKTLVGFVPQDDVVHLGLTVEKTLDYAAQLRLHAEMPDVRRQAVVRSVLAQVELTDRAGVRVRNLSGGQRKRVSIAVELLAQPPLLFLDEPTSGLDPALEARTMQLFRGFTGQGRLTVVTTHVLASLDVVDLVIIVSRGRLVFVGPPADAPAFFGVADLPSVYRVLSKDSPDEWARKLLAAPTYRQHVIDRLSTPPPALPGPGAAPVVEEASSPVDAVVAPVTPAAPAPPKSSPEEELARLKAARDKS